MPTWIALLRGINVGGKNPLALKDLVLERSERFELGDGVLYLHTPAGLARSKLAASVERAMGVPVTARNWRTVQRLCAMAGAP